ncbi:MAG: hypothetical protein CMO34_07990 [Verrucomicrobia bacterium]|nr:hypothetical protein [Verrucomicrobiota bacterium]
MMSHHDFWICSRGIYSAEKAYGDELDYTWYVEFDNPEDVLEEQWAKFMKKVWKEAGDARGREICSLLGAKLSRF